MPMDALPHSNQTSSPDIVYAYKPSLMGAPFELRLTASGLEWSRGRYGDRIPYDRVRRLRLSFRPVTMQPHRFLAEIWPTAGPKLQVASTSWRSVVEQERLDAAYGAFIRELHRRLAAAGTQASFETGRSARFSAATGPAPIGRMRSRRRSCRARTRRVG